PLAILYVLQYLGFQEVSIPMHRGNPVAFMEFSEPRVYTLIAVCLLVGGVLVSLVVESSRFGLALLAIRQNELAAEAAGINTRQWKMRSLVVSGMLAAVAGGFYARVLLVVTPDSVFGMLVSAQAVVVTLFGGVASVWGPLIGAEIGRRRRVLRAGAAGRDAGFRVRDARLGPGRGGHAVRRRGFGLGAADRRRDRPSPAGSTRGCCWS